MFRLLGPLQVHDGTGWVGAGAGKQRLLLATLLVRAGQVVPTEQLVHELWGEHPPKTAATQVHGYVLRLRRLLGDRDGRVLGTVAPGYRLAEGATDAAEFAVLAERGHQARRDGDHERAAELLAAALAVWRGPAFADVPASDKVAAEAVRLAEERLAALDARVDADLACGRHTALVAELSRLVGEHPLRERFWQQLMVAQSRAGLRAEALHTYQRVRDVMVGELGVEPGAALRDLHRRILDGDQEPADPVRPAVVVPRICQLPADIPDFTGRRDQLGTLTTLLADRSPDAPPVVAVLSGGPGIGKSTLALHAARAVADGFPDGQLYLDLAGTAPRPRDPAVLLAEVLHALGVTGAAVPDGLGARAALYRSLLADHGMLLVLDDAATAEQVRWLVPPTGASAAIVTSRGVLTGLPGARHLELDVLGIAEAGELFTHIVGAERVAREPEHAAAIVRACGHLPLAIRIAGGKLLGRPGWSLRVLRERLEDESRRLSELRLGDLGVRASFDLSLHHLAPDDVRALRLLGTLGPQTVPGWVLGPLLDRGGTDERTADDQLDALVDANLLRVVGTDDNGEVRYRLHDLVRAYAVEGAESIPSGERRAALARLLATWLDLATRVADALPPSLFRPPPGTAPRRCAPADVVRRAVADPVCWFDAERAALLGAVSVAAEWGLAGPAWELATVAVAYYDHHSRYEDWRRGHEVALTAVRAGDDRLGEAVLLRGLAQVDIYRDLFEPATANLTRSVALFREVGDKLGEGLATAGLGTIHRVLDEHGPALARATEALELVAASGDRNTEAQLMCAIGAMHLARGDLDPAASWFTEALDLCRALGDRHREAVVLREMSDLFDQEEALARLARALDIFTELADDRCVAYTLVKSGEIHADRAGAVPALERAAGIFRRNGSRLDEARCWELLAGFESRHGNAAGARRHLDQARTLWQSVGATGRDVSLTADQATTSHWKDAFSL
ncbi:AfsR/SARP family transcriptional regulator [Actinophytocola algeriensis]|uniref:DNA-binding SARP family transcriptional activator n=1 Tax=Actinophytocola algeriensis TaxID=1768010 RepID=A0A7W7VIU7_9PSEU|nr:BTAD domain-containing putative transcriptional regulator [Actinophytocola algeriensis]MBB4911654.1 DNA-binding SARP family transcriptional activator [Actinophytocola algeriensis]MBE1473358.1 DNA-binding SARP family transcriptional activator [Actinophytocola algeriensis]